MDSDLGLGDDGSPIRAPVGRGQSPAILGSDAASASTGSGSSSIVNSSTRSYPACGNSFLHHLHTAPKSKHVNLPTSAPMSKVPSSASISGHYAPSSAPSLAAASPKMTDFSHAYRPPSPVMDLPPSPKTSSSPSPPPFPEIPVQRVSRSRRRPSAAQTHSADDLVMPTQLVAQAGPEDENVDPLLRVSGEREGTGGRLSAPSLDRGSSFVSSVSTSGESVAEANARNLTWNEFARQYSRGRFDPVRTPCAPNADMTSPLAGPSRSTEGPARSRNAGSFGSESRQVNSEPITRAEQFSVAEQGPSSAPAMAIQIGTGAIPAYRHNSWSHLHSPTDVEDSLQGGGGPILMDELQEPPAPALSADHLTFARSFPSPGALSDSGSTATDHSAGSSSIRPRSVAEVGSLPPSAGLLHRNASAFNHDPLPTIQASPAETPNDEDFGASKRLPRAAAGALRHIPAASAPIQPTSKPATSSPPVDYFGPAVADSPVADSVEAAAEASEKVLKEFHIEGPHAELTEWPTMRSTSQCEPFYDKYGFLAAPPSPYEAQRLKALYSYNILHTAADINFDRIAHMIKLVFKAKMTFISLLDGESCWFKAKSGFVHNHIPRTTSMCSHTILLESDEPLVILDTRQDWRFANNPHVLSDPTVRFYAGAPLRTSKGHNLGSLCITDDQPRDEFPPRSRHILKEFAAIVMRELELWRDRLQLRTRDKIQTSMANFTRECLEIDDQLSTAPVESEKSMEVVYSRAAKLVRNTLELDGCAILDISQFERTEVRGEDGEQTVIFHATPYAEDGARLFERAQVFGPVNAFPVLATAPQANLQTRQLTPVEHEKLSMFLSDHRDGRIFENVAPSWIRYIFPPSLKYGMVVPVIGIDKQPFALICAYTHDKGKQFLEGYELQFLRAIGVIILSAVLRRRMMVADRSKSVLISSVSHELRTPLHGILAASELLGDSQLDDNQASLLSTVRTCGLQLIETVNHVLDFTKLSGGAKNRSRTNITMTKTDLSELVLQTVESCWLGQRGRSMQTGDSDVGSFYAPVLSGLLPHQQRVKMQQSLAHVETVLDIGIREKGWNVICESGGLRRILMNLYGNSLKFTSKGYVQIVLRELPHPPGAKRVPVQLAVIDTGRGISKTFLRDQLFQPFSQENPMQPGTGLGLAIVNSIARSESMNGSVEVWSIEGEGTEIRVTFDVEIDEEDDSEAVDRFAGLGLTVAVIGFDPEHRGQALMAEVMSGYATYLGYEKIDDADAADVLIVNELAGVTPDKIERRRKQPLIVIVTWMIWAQDKLRTMGLENSFVRVFCKPMVRYSLLKELVQAARFVRHGPDEFEKLRGGIGQMALNDRMGSGAVNDSMPSSEGESSFAMRPLSLRGDSNDSNSNMTMSDMVPASPFPRRRSAEQTWTRNRPRLAPRGTTYHGSLSASDDGITVSPTTSSSTISLADGGALLKAAAIPEDQEVEVRRRARVMVVEDNAINRRVLSAFLRKKGFEYAETVDGSAGVQLFEETSPNWWDVILMDITMPIMNGYEATRTIRGIESERRTKGLKQKHTKIFALTGLAMQDDKRKAFGSGVDGYLVKPVSLTSLDMLFKKIGF